MISARYAVAVCAVAALALVPTLIHSYAGVVVTDARTTALIPERLAGYASVPSGRDALWGSRRFESQDWIERRYTTSGDEVVLTVLRSYDLKVLYHHPENDVAYGAGFLRSETVRLPERPDVPLHVLHSDVDGGAAAVYVLHYGDRLIDDPYVFQIRTAGELLFSGRRQMTLFFAHDTSARKDDRPETSGAARLVLAALDGFLASDRAAR
jgi:hypothetical protein